MIQSGRADAIIIGLSPQNFVEQNRCLASFPVLETQDLEKIITWPCNLVGDVYDEERDEHRCHAKMMRYNLNSEQKRRTS